MDSNSFIQALMKAAASKQENGEDPIIDLSTLENFAPDAAEEPTFSEDGRDWPFDKLAYEYRLLGAPSIDLVSAEDLTPLVFYRDFVSKNLPVLIDGAIDKWPALTKWKSDEYLRSVIGETEVTVDFTPDGRGDSIVQDKLFVTPCEEKLKFSEFLNLLQDDAGEDGESEGESKQGVSNGSSSAASISSTASPTAGSSSSRPSRPGVPYCQHQNSSFCDEFKSLHQDAALDISFATEAFGAKPEAVNFWMVCFFKLSLSLSFSSSSSYSSSLVYHRILNPPIQINTYPCHPLILIIIPHLREILALSPQCTVIHMRICMLL